MTAVSAKMVTTVEQRFVHADLSNGKRTDGGMS